MSVRIQVIVDENEAAKFKSQALKESKSLSAWLRDAGRKVLQESKPSESLTEVDALKRFFSRCNQREKGREPDWGEHKQLIQEGFRSGQQV
jgi:hypothetical protein